MGSNGQPLIIIGDVGVDLVLGPVAEWPQVGTEIFMERSELRAGGSGGNTALAVSYLGGSSRLLSAVGEDDLGVWLTQQLRDLGASLQVCALPTTLSVGVIHACGERTLFTTRGHLEQLSYEHVQARLPPASHSSAIALLTGAFLTPHLRAAYPQLIRQLRTLGYQVALDANWPPQNWTTALRDELAGWIADCDHVLLNEMEVSSLIDCDDPASASDRAATLLRRGAVLVVKMAARGAIAIQDGRHYSARAPQVPIFDTIGAGDSFNAGYLLARLAGSDLPTALCAGCSSASAVISRFPRRGITRGELADHIAAAHRPAMEPT